MAESAELAAAQQQPLKGTVLCCTSVTQDVRTKVAEAANAMGANHSLDLTGEVTHLIVGSVTTPKYRYVAKERPDIVVLHPDWIDAVRVAWMEGGDVDVAQLEKDFRLPAFFGLKMCVSGFDNLDQRNFISSTMEKQGAEYHGDLTKQVSHLVVATASGAKYTAAKQWGVKVVSLKWFEDCLQRGMALDENLYDPLLPPEEQGKDAFRIHAKPRTSLGKRTREGTIRAQAAEESGKRKLRRTASSRLNTQSQDLWQDISAREDDTEVSTVDQWKDEPAQAKEAVVERPSTPQVTANLAEKTNEPANIFVGRHVLIQGFDEDRKRRLNRFLEPNGASVATTISDLEQASCDPTFKARYLLVPHALDSVSLELPEVPKNTKMVTEWWLERCIQSKSVLDPAEDVLSCPLWEFPRDVFSSLTVFTTGFKDVDFRQIAEAVKLTGATYADKLTSSVSVLVCGPGDMSKEKVFYAIKKSIPVVSSNWLWTCLRNKRVVAFDGFKMALSGLDSVEPMNTSSASSSAKGAKQPTESSKRNDVAVSSKAATTFKQPARAPLVMTTKKPATTVSGPFMHEDDDDNNDHDHESLKPCQESGPVPRHTEVPSGRGMPLGDISPNVSPRKIERQHTAEQDDGEDSNVTEHKRSTTPEQQSDVHAPSPPTSVVSETTKHPPTTTEDDLAPKRTEELAANLASLLNRTASSRNGTLSGSSSPTTKRKNRPLGRNLSGIANTHRSASPALSSGIHTAADGFECKAATEPLPPSTQLGYESIAQEQHRIEAEKRMNVHVSNEGDNRRVPSLGTVKDSVGPGGRDAGVGARIRARNRAK